ncbi:hypothetical protein [Levilactobacillus zymae]|uniref:Uncharacterized protein n=1 Tax=Levilactobacillus zymae TaxID=267363 RepID=A0A1Y6K1Z6_9LACO|nr:hypothetical protein [Levilactobacillus zymae]SMS14584.1 hypothetical protein LZ3411_1534 [Levilactobacillus zymae]
MLQQRKRDAPTRPILRGWLLPDALLALSLVTLTLVFTQQALQVTVRVERQRQHRLERARYHRDQRLEKWLAS